MSICIDMNWGIQPPTPRQFQPWPCVFSSCGPVECCLPSTDAFFSGNDDCWVSFQLIVILGAPSMSPTDWPHSLTADEPVSRVLLIATRRRTPPPPSGAEIKSAELQRQRRTVFTSAPSKDNNNVVRQTGRPPQQRSTWSLPQLMIDNTETHV